MSKREDYESRTEELLTPIAEVNQVEIYDVEYVKEGSDYYLRAYIDKPEGVNILDSFDADTVTITEEGTPRTFARADVALIRLALDF